MSRRFETHEVFNQPPPFVDVNLFDTDPALREAVAREGIGPDVAALASLGARCGSAEMAEHARLANEHPPRLLTHDAGGRRRDTVEFHPSYHACMALSTGAGLAGMQAAGVLAGAVPRGAHVARAAAFYMTAQMEAGHCCPITMTNAAAPTLAMQMDVALPWLEKMAASAYDPAFAPLAGKRSATIGMGMTEVQGGTDVRANTTRAEPTEGAGGPGRAYVLTGHKWFMSAPMCDAFLILAQAGKGLSCFLVPRFRPDGDVNALRFQRLKVKLGNHSNASSEVELHEAMGWLVGEEGRGVPVIIEMVAGTRLDCAVASAAHMRLALARAIHHARHRTVFQRRLVDQPLMAHVLADLAVEVEAATALAFRLARSFDLAADPRAAAWRRLMTPVTKYWVCKLAPLVVGEVLECLGGSGYVEESGLPRLYREAPLNAIWEGSGNVMALDVLRVLQREPEVAETVLAELEGSVSGDPRLVAGIERIRALLHEPRLLDGRARTLVETMARVAAGAVLIGHAPAPVAEAFVATRLGNEPRQTFGQGLDQGKVGAIIARALAPVG